MQRQRDKKRRRSGYFLNAGLPARGVVVSASASVLVGREVDSWPGLTKTL